MNYVPSTTLTTRPLTNPNHIFTVRCPRGTWSGITLVTFMSSCSATRCLEQGVMMAVFDLVEYLLFVAKSLGLLPAPRRLQCGSPHRLFPRWSLSVYVFIARAVHGAFREQKFCGGETLTLVHDGMHGLFCASAFWRDWVRCILLLV